MTKILRAIGLMSGTSLDGVDAAIIETDGENHFSLGNHLTIPIGKTLRQDIKNLFDNKGDLLKVANDITSFHAQLVIELLKLSNLSANDIDLLGFHGQTIIHRPKEAITQQIGNGALLAELTGINVITDFRTRDVAAGGQGAPLVPLYHACITHQLAKPIAVVNIGGVSNITYIDDNLTIAFDVGPGNALVDDLIFDRTGKNYDKGGSIASNGSIDDSILSQGLMDEFFISSPPKSLDRNHFKINVDQLSTEDAAATLTAFTAKSIACSAKFLPKPPKEWLICGGGRHNLFLMELLKKYIQAPVSNIDKIGVNGDFIEAEAFGYLAVRSYYGLPLSLPSTTGVGRPVTGGAFYRA